MACNSSKFSIPQLTIMEEEHIRGVLQRCNYLKWVLNRLKIKNNKYNNQKATTNLTTIKNNTFTW